MGKVIKGRFGKPCQDCDGIIPGARLRVQPKARLCVECETFEEKRRARSIALASRVAKEVEGISRQLGDWRKRAGIECITLAFARKPLQHNDIEPEGDFTNTPEIGDKTSNIKAWCPDDARPAACDFDTDLGGFDWADKRNERRRQREKRAA